MNSEENVPASAEVITILSTLAVATSESQSKSEAQSEVEAGANAVAETDSENSTTFTAPWSKPSIRRRREFSVPDDTTLQQRPIRSEARSRLLKSVAQGRIWLEQLLHDRSADFISLAKQQGVSEKSIRATLSLAFIAPDIVEAAIEGRLLRGLTVTQMTGLPSDWKLQRQALGMT